MRLVISGYFGAGNAGDEAILAGLLRSLRAIDAGAHHVTVISSDPASTERLHSVDAVPRARPATVTAIRRADGLITGGGGLLQDVTSSRPPLYYGGLGQLARVLGRPYVALAQGLGPLQRPLSRRVARAALDHASHVSLRDEPSVELAREIGVRRPIDLVPDLALGLEAPQVEASASLVIAVRGRGLRPSVLGMLRSALAALTDLDEVIALPMHEPFDRPASEAVVRDISRGRVTPPDPGHGTALRTIGSARLVIGMRLHALVFAALAGIPAVAIPYDPKVRAFAAAVGQRIIDPMAPGAATALVSLGREALRSGPSTPPGWAETERGRVRAAVATALAALGDAGA